LLFLEVIAATANLQKKKRRKQATTTSINCMQVWKFKLKRRKFMKETAVRMAKRDKNPHHHNATCRFSIKNSAVE
jgi:hypothetical protein